MTFTVSSRRRLAALVSVLALTAACGGGGGEPAAKPKPVANVPSTTTTTAPPTVPAPLRGLPVEPEVAARPAVTVKVDNARAARPQAGLDDADLLYEERVEGGVTRFLAVFHSTDSKLVGPIRSVRATDVGIVAPLGGVFVFSSGARQVVRQAEKAPVTTVSELGGSGPFTYPPGRKRPLKTFGATERLRQEVSDRHAAAPPALFDFLGAGEPFAPDGTPTAGATVVYGPRTTADFTWDAASATWLRSSDGQPHLLEGGARLAVTNVIVQPVAYRDAGYKDSAGSRVDEAVLTGSGEATVLSQGRRITARWTKEGGTGVTRFTDAAGQPLRLPPGNTMVLLPASGSAISFR